MTDILPDSRPRETKGRVTGPNGTVWIPIYCINCGASTGGVPEEMMTFVCFICDDCVGKHGVIANLYLEPDAVFWKKVEDYQLEKAGRLMTEIEIVKEINNPSESMRRLLLDAPKPR